MTYFRPLERTNSKGEPLQSWHYTATNDGITIPVGHCAKSCPGHDTPEGAREHFKEFLLDEARYDGRLSNQQHKCDVCGEWTSRMAQIPSQYVTHVLCDEHCNREGLAQVLKVGDSAQS